mgnify:FL=1
MEIPKSKLRKRVEHPNVETKNFTAGCSMCDRTFSVIIPANVVPDSLTDRALMTDLRGQFNMHNASHGGQAQLTLVG